MPPKVKVTKEDILNKAIEIVRNEGEAALNARNLALKLNSSTQPIFSNYKNMEDLKLAVISEAGRMYGEYIKEDILSGKYPKYKSSGIAYIRFAKNEKELFKLLFMRDRREEEKDDEEVTPIIKSIMEATGFSEKTALLFHLEMWAFVHGIATMFATNYLELDFNLVSDMLTLNFHGLHKVFKANENERS